MRTVRGCRARGAREDRPSRRRSERDRSRVRPRPAVPPDPRLPHNPRPETLLRTCRSVRAVCCSVVTASARRDGPSDARGRTRARRPCAIGRAERPITAATKMRAQRTPCGCFVRAAMRGPRWTDCGAGADEPSGTGDHGLPNRGRLLSDHNMECLRSSPCPHCWWRGGTAGRKSVLASRAPTGHSAAGLPRV